MDRALLDGDSRAEHGRRDTSRHLVRDRNVAGRAAVRDYQTKHQFPSTVSGGG